jgi:Pentapeptide repeats (9 copies)
MPAWAWALSALAAVVVTAGIVTTWLWIVAGQAGTNADRTSARLDAVHTGLAAGAGAGAAVGLMLAFRRQHHHEIATAMADLDATERRVTELYAKAAELLGSDKAAARLAGLYALERLAQDNSGQRQTIVNVICAYLRMPFTPPAGWSSLPRTVSKIRGSPVKANSEIFAELQVRLAAESILSSHLRGGRLRGELHGVPTDPQFWEDTRLDLSGATLVNPICWVGCRLESANFNQATFIDGVNFAHAEFGQVFFHDARFVGGSAHFYGAWFEDRAIFAGTDFGSEEATFDDARFHGVIFFDDAKFGGGASFDNAEAFVAFNRSWGSKRTWPPGWREDPTQRASQEGWIRVVPARRPQSGQTKRTEGPRS